VPSIHGFMMKLRMKIRFFSFLFFIPFDRAALKNDIHGLNIPLNMFVSRVIISQSQDLAILGTLLKAFSRESHY
jgi:hypothetical protein